MEREIIESARLKGKYWWSSLIIGILAFFIGILASIEPFATVGVLTLFFTANFLISGIFEIVFAISNRNNMGDWGWTLQVALSTLYLQ